MANDTQHADRGRGIPWRVIGWGTAAFLLLLPLVTNAPWTLSDYIFAGVLFAAVGGVFELAVRLSRNHSYRAAVAFALAAAFLIVWANGAVGMIGDEGNPFNLMFYAVILMALAGAVAARFRPAGTAIAMMVAAVAQVAVSVAGLSTDLRGGILSAGFAGLWLLSAALFRKAAQEQSFT